MITAEEFFREKIKQANPELGEFALATYNITGEQGLRWAKEYSDYILSQTAPMGKIAGNVNLKVDFAITLKLSKGEAQALNAIACYGTDAFLETFYAKMGKSYLQPHEIELRGIFAKLKNDLSIEISKIEKAEEKIKEALNTFK